MDKITYKKISKIIIAGNLLFSGFATSTMVFSKSTPKNDFVEQSFSKAVSDPGEHNLKKLMTLLQLLQNDELSKENLEKTKQLIRNIVQADIDYALDESQLTLLMLAAGKKHFDVVKLLIEKGANVNAKDNTQVTPLMFASFAGHEGIVQTLIQAGADVNAKDECNQTALMFASSEGYGEIVQTLIQAGADVNARDTNGRTALTLAEDDDIAEYLRMCLATNKLFSLMTKDELKLSDLEEIRLLIDGGVNLDETNAEGDTLLICAVKLGYLSIVTHLIEVGADVNAKDKKYGLTALMWAVFKGRLDIVGYLLTLTEAIDVNVGSQNGCTALMMAAWLPESKGQTIVERLLQQKKPKPIDVNQQNENGQTALMIAVQAGNFEVVKKLVEAKADVNARDTNGRTALTLAKNDDIAEYLRMCLAAEQLFSLMTKKEPKLSEVEEIGLLIDGGVNLDKTNKEGDTLLICAVKSGYLSIVTHLIEVGADVNAKDKKYGLTALMWAVFKGRLDIVGYLLTLTEAIDVNAGSKNGCTALMIAAWLPESKGQTIVERLLQQKELNVNQQNENGQTALMIAVQAGNFEVVKKLVEAGAKVDIKDKKGRTAVMYVDNVKEHPEIVKYLKRRSFGDKVAFWENFITEKNAETSKNSRATTHTERRRNH